MNATGNYIPFNRPYLTGKEVHFIYDAVASGHISGNGKYTKLCQQFFEHRFGFKKTLLTTSCTDALEMCALLLDIKKGDEVIVPSFTFVSSALAFVRQGAKIIFADSCNNHPGMDAGKIESLITNKTKAIVVVHYAGNACEMDRIVRLADKYDVHLIEDAAQAIDSWHQVGDDLKQPLGSIGTLAAFSFHETKNVQCGEGGLLVINDDRFSKRAEVIWEKGTNRAAFFRGEVDKYGWVDTGSSFLPSEITSAFLWAQLAEIDKIQAERIAIWNYYNENLKEWAYLNNIQMPVIPEFATNNAHMFYMVCKSLKQRTELIKKLRDQGVYAVFHYQSLHTSTFYKHKYAGEKLNNADKYSECLIRLPLFIGLDAHRVCQIINRITLNQQ